MFASILYARKRDKALDYTPLGPGQDVVLLVAPVRWQALCLVGNSAQMQDFLEENRSPVAT